MRGQSRKGKEPAQESSCANKKRKSTRSSSRALEDDPTRPENHGIVIEDGNEREVFADFVTRGIESTYFPSKEVLVSLGLFDNLKCLFDTIGWGAFLDDTIEDRRTYGKITLEIMSTIEIGPILNIRDVSFQLFGDRRTLSLEEIDECYGVPHGGLRLHKTAYSPLQFWGRISNTKSFRSGYSKASEVCNPVLRMALKIISNTVVARRENTSVRPDDLFILEAMLSGTHIHFCHLFLSQVKKQLSGTGKITIGGMLTPWAKKFHVGLNGCPHLDEKYLLDIKKLCFIQFISNSKAPYFFLFHDKDSRERRFPLPNVKLVLVTDIHDTTNWKMNLPSHTRAIQEKIFDFGGVYEGESSRQEEEGPPHTSSHGEFEAFGIRVSTMEDRLSTMHSTFDRRFDTMEAHMERQFATMGTQVNRVERSVNSMVTLFEQFRDFQVSQGLPWPRPPPL